MTNREMLKEGKETAKNIAWLAKHMDTEKGRKKIAKRNKKDAKRFARNERLKDFFNDTFENSTAVLILAVIVAVLSVIAVAALILNWGNIIQWILGIFR